ncbi:MAG: glutamate 5-kinase [Anaerolineaceae bacterium]|nr:glutamate 5-kinase [Anaerolineaceae bacterium]
MPHQRIVVKFGTSTLTAGTPNLSLPQMVELARQVSALHSAGNLVILVSSGAIAAGKEALNHPDLPKFIPSKQMLAAVGQPRLMALYAQLFGLFGKTVAQVLLTSQDLSDRQRYLNAFNTLEALLSQSVIPIINENDTVATEEIRFGDNDNLSAMVANLVGADLLLLLTDQAGLFTADPRSTKDATLVREVATPDIPEELWQAAGGAQTRLGTGGMVTKLQAADLARRSGTMVVIAHGGEKDILLRIAAGEAIGTRLLPVITTLENRKRYILSGRRTRGVVRVDDGAVNALRKGGSLLPVGVTALEGGFNRGDTVRIVSPSGNEIALGLVNYAAKDMELLRGRQSSEIESLLGYTFGDEVIHHNNLFLL